VRRRPVPGTPFSTTPVLRSQRQVISNGEIGAATVNEETLRVGVGSGYDPAPVASRVEHKSPAFQVARPRYFQWLRSRRRRKNKPSQPICPPKLHCGSPGTVPDMPEIVWCRRKAARSHAPHMFRGAVIRHPQCLRARFRSSLIST